ncbi:MAG: phosphate acyltransferase PlsX [Endomicrobium sp.]|jgi:glycerol-3-phosphate acyltransferase PlsX|nr:phosphate acyltransferase PlsX [Endomicrobium sp.]
MIIALDAMGGDFAPNVTIEGAVLAAQHEDRNILLVGPEKLLLNKLEKYKNNNRLAYNKIEIIDANESILMSEHPAKAVRHKKNSSIAVCAKLVADKKADAFVSMGNSGAIMTAALLYLGRLRGILRPAITTVLPTTKGACILADIGANVDCKPEYLFQFGIMSSIFCKKVIKIKKPKVALLSIGEEASKGNELTLATYSLLNKTIGINFIGNIEGKDICHGKADVVICDGFTGNILLKFGEGITDTMLYLIKQKILSSPIKWFLLPFFHLIKKTLQTKFDYSRIGGAPLLGVNGVCIVGHGRSNSIAVKNAVAAAVETVKYDVLNEIESNLHRYL